MVEGRRRKRRKKYREVQTKLRTLVPDAARGPLNVGDLRMPHLRAASACDTPIKFGLVGFCSQLLRRREICCNVFLSFRSWLINLAVAEEFTRCHRGASWKKSSDRVRHPRGNPSLKSLRGGSHRLCTQIAPSQLCPCKSLRPSVYQLLNQTPAAAYHPVMSMWLADCLSRCRRRE